MSSHTSPAHYPENALATDANFKVEISQKMKVPDKISFNTDMNGITQSGWLKDSINMQVPERILVAGRDQHIGTKAPPREIVFDNSMMHTEPSPNVPRVATPPRTLTLDKYPYPGIEEYEAELEEHERLPVAKPKVIYTNMNDSDYIVPRGSAPVGGSGDSLTTSEEMLHLRKQMAKLNRRVMALELETMNRLQKEKFIVGIGVAYFLLKVIIWLNRD